MSNVIALGDPPILRVMQDAVYAHWRKQGWHPNPERYYPLSQRYDWSNPSALATLFESMRLSAIDVAYQRLKAIDPKRTQQVKVSVCYRPGETPSTTVLLSLEDISNRITTYT